MEDSSVERRAAHARWRVEWKTETALNAVLSDPAVQRLKEEIDQLEASLAHELGPRLGRFQERYDRAARDGDYDLLIRTCPGKHGRWGRVCVLDVGHEAEYPHWGTTPGGQPVAWVGTAPGDD